MSSGVILLAAGRSIRFGRGLPKQFLRLKNEPLYFRSLRVFSSLASVKEVVVVGARGYLKRMESEINRLGLKKKWQVIEGGNFRGESVRNGFLHLSEDLDVVLVHDAARPLVNVSLVRLVEKEALKKGAAVPAWPVPDTIKVSSLEGRVKKTIPRKNLWLTQTPQGFRRDIAKKCLPHPSPNATDDVELAEKKGFRVFLVKGNPLNIKVTYPHDLKICQALLSKK